MIHEYIVYGCAVNINQFENVSNSLGLLPFTTFSVLKSEVPLKRGCWTIGLQ